MKYFVYLSGKDKSNLEYEIISHDLRVHLTRLIEHNAIFKEHSLIYQNWLINRSRTLVGQSIYVLESYDGEYEEHTYAWHNGEFELCLRRLDTQCFVELLCEIIERGFLVCAQVNELLKIENSSFRLSASQLCNE